MGVPAGGRAPRRERGGHVRGAPADAWSPVLRAPKRWLRDYVGAMQRAWHGLEPLWRRSAALLDREIERVTAAAERGAVAELVDALHPYSSLSGDAWRLFERPDPVGLRLRDRRLVVTPLIADSICLLDCDDAGGLRSLSYPLPRAWEAFDGSAPPPASLDALLGPSRAALLRSLDRPTPAGRLADALPRPERVTHHLRALEPAGLIARERFGRRVLVHRTARGTRLLALYEAH